MSVEKFELVLANGTFSRAERTWFPKWWLRFREYLIHHYLLLTEVDQSIVIRFLQQIKSAGTRAWKRLQAVQAIEAYFREAAGANQSNSHIHASGNETCLTRLTTSRIKSYARSAYSRGGSVSLRTLTLLTRSSPRPTS